MSGGQNPAGEVSAGVPSAIFPDYPAGQGGDGPATVVHHGRVRAVLEEELYHPQGATLCGPEEGGHPSTFLAPWLKLGWSRRRATTPSQPHPAASISGVQPSPSWALGSRPWASRSLVRLRLPSRLALRSWVWHRANGTILVREDYLLPISNLLYSVLDPSYSIPHGHG